MENIINIILLSILLYYIFKLYKQILRWKTLYWPVMSIFGHRGAIIPGIIENRISAFQFAIDNHAYGLELDTRLTKDNQLVVFHNTSIENKNTGEYQQIHQHALSELQLISEPQIQTLDNFFLWLKSTSTPNYPLNIEIKMDTNNSVLNKQQSALILLKTIQKYRPLFYNITIQCFDIELLREIRNITTQPVTSFLVETQEELNIFLRSQKYICQVDILSPHFSLVNKYLIMKMHKYGVKVLPWTVNSIKVFNKLSKMGIDGIITDYPHLMTTLPK
jgi:glycerophosphoryl diester phosphodiesterase